MSDANATDEEFADLIGQTLDGRYRIEQVLGSGGMGGVLRAVHVGLRNDVAVKVLRARFGETGETAKRFEREAHSASRLDHPNCVRVTDFGSTADGRRYLVMPFLDGRELQDLLGEPFETARAVELGIQLFRGLAHAHRQGIVHRDLKPANVFVTFDDRDRETIKLVDFGIAKLINDTVFDEKLTRAGVIFGTPRYMSPEQASGGKVDARTDLYSGGLLLYQMLAGHPPFEVDDAPALLRMHMIAPPPPLPEQVPAPLRELVMRLLEKLPDQRPKSADEVVDALEAIRVALESADPEPAPAPAPVPTPAPVPPPVVANPLARPLAALDSTTRGRAPALATRVYGVTDATLSPPAASLPASAPVPAPGPAPTRPASQHTVRAMEPAPAPGRKSDNTALYVIAACVALALFVFMVVVAVGLADDEPEGASDPGADAAGDPKADANKTAPGPKPHKKKSHKKR